MEQQQEKQQPIIKLFSSGVSLNVWPQKKDDKTYYQVSIQRKYIKNNEEVYETMHFFPDVLLPLSELLREAYSSLNVYKQEIHRQQKELQKKWEEA